MAKEENGLDRLVRRVRKGLSRDRSSLGQDSVPAASLMAAEKVEPRRQRPYLEPLEPRILLSADVGLVPDALLAPPTDEFDPRLILEPEVHDEVLVREPSKFESISRQAFRDATYRGLEVVPEAERERLAEAQIVELPAAFRPL